MMYHRLCWPPETGKLSCDCSALLKDNFDNFEAYRPNSGSDTRTYYVSPLSAIASSLTLHMIEVSEVAQSRPTLCDPKNCGLSCSSVHGILQARLLERVANCPFNQCTQSIWIMQCECAFEKKSLGVKLFFFFRIMKN